MNPGVVVGPYDRALSGTAEERFRKVVRWLHEHGYFPTPTAILRQLTGRCAVRSNLNGRQSRWRIEELEALGYTKGPPTGGHNGYWITPEGKSHRA